MKRCIVVLGMHRSGTSLMTGLLQIFGVYLGGDLMEAVSDRNPKGHFEHNRIYRINEEILTELDSSWDDIKGLPKNWHKLKRISEYKERIKRIIKEDFGKLDMFGLKEPRICILLPLYLEIFRELKIEPLFVIMMRKEIEVAKSLKKIYNLSLNKSLELYKKYNNNIEKYTKKKKRIYVEFDDLINNVEKVIDRIRKELNVSFRDYKSVKKEVENLSGPKLKHYNLDYIDFIKEIGEELENQDKKIGSLSLEVEKRNNLLLEKDNQLLDKDNQVLMLENTLDVIKHSRTWVTVQKFDRVIRTFFPYLITNQSRIKQMSLPNINSNIVRKTKLHSNQEKTLSRNPIQRKNNDRKKILFINHEETRTGAPKIAFEVAKEMKRYYDVKMVSLMKGFMHEEFINEFGEIVYPDESLRHIKNHPIIRKIILKENPDLVYVNSVVSYAYAIEAKKLGIPVIFHVHELEEGFNKGMPGINTKDFCNWADIFIAVSGKVYDYIIQRKKCDAEKVVLINEFVSHEEIIEKSKMITEEEINKEINKKPGQIIVVSVGSMINRKGADLLIHAQKILKNKGGFKDIKFIWIGKLYYDWKIMAARFNKDSDFLILGEKENPFPYLKQADIFVLPSREDPFPLVALEAMALGKPIIAFRDGGGIPEAIENCCGIVVERISSLNLAESIIDLCSKPNLIKKFSKNGKEKQRLYYDNQVVIPKIHELIRKYLDLVLDRVQAASSKDNSLIKISTEQKQDEYFISDERKKKKVSIVLPSYNYAWCIDEAIDSVLAQDYKNWELIIVDDGSTDNSFEVIEKYAEKYPEKIKLFFHPNKDNQGLAEAYKLGLTKCDGEFIAFIEADDVWHPDYLSSKIPIFEKHKDIILVYNNVEMFGEKDVINKKKKQLDYLFYGVEIKKDAPFHAFKFLLNHNYIPTFSCFVLRREALIELNITEKYNAWFDWWILAQISLKGKFYLQSEKLTKWRIHEKSYDEVEAKILGDSNLVKKIDMIKRDIYNHMKNYIAVNQEKYDPRGFSELENALERTRLQQYFEAKIQSQSIHIAYLEDKLKKLNGIK